MKKYIYLFVFFILIGSSMAQWKQIETIPSKDVSCLFTNNNNIYAGANFEVYISTNNGKDWHASSKIDEQTGIDFVSAVISYKNKIFAGTYNFGVYLSEDNGESWTQINQGLFGAGGKTIIDLVVRGDSVYAGTSGAGIFVMDLNNPFGWIHYSNGLFFEISYNIYSLKLIDNVIYAGAGGNGTFYKNDGSSSLWKEVKFGELEAQPLIMCDIIKFNSEFFVSATYGIYKSKDGVNWNYTNPGVGFIWSSNFAVYGQKIYVHLSKGSGRTYLFESADFGESWNFLEQLDGNEIYNMTVLDNKIFAGRFYGLWFLDLNMTDVNDGIIPEGFILHQNYPNPFNPTTSIEYRVGSIEKVTLKIYDVLGRETTTLVDEVKTPGIYKVTFNSSHSGLSRGMASGVYFYRLSAGNFTETKKLILVK